MVLNYMPLCAAEQRICTTGETLRISPENSLERKKKIHVLYDDCDRQKIICVSLNGPNVNKTGIDYGFVMCDMSMQLA